MTTPTSIDRDAPVIAHHQIDITAPLETIWRLQARESRAGRTVPPGHHGLASGSLAISHNC